MKALLLAAGLGTRLRPITNHIPKCLVPIRKKPLLSYWLDLLFKNGVERVYINTHYLSQAVHDFIQTTPWRHAIELLHEQELLGTAGTIYKNRHLFSEGPFLLAHADNLTRFDVKSFFAVHHNRPPETEITMMTFDTDSPSSCGIVDLDGYGKVIGFYEKSTVFRGTRANGAVYILEPTILEYLAAFKKEVIDMSTEVLPAYLGKIQTYHNADYHRDIGTLESLQLAEKEF